MSGSMNPCTASLGNGRERGKCLEAIEPLNPRRHHLTCDFAYVSILVSQEATIFNLPVLIFCPSYVEATF
jgi:hypothetical protein